MNKNGQFVSAIKWPWFFFVFFSTRKRKRGGGNCTHSNSTEKKRKKKKSKKKIRPFSCPALQSDDDIVFCQHFFFQHLQLPPSPLLKSRLLFLGNHWSPTKKRFFFSSSFSSASSSEGRVKSKKREKELSRVHFCSFFCQTNFPLFFFSSWLHCGGQGGEGTNVSNHFFFFFLPSSSCL